MASPPPPAAARGTALVLTQYGAASDPTSRHTCESLQAAGWRVAAGQPARALQTPSPPVPGVEYHSPREPGLTGPLRRLNGPVRFWRYRRLVRGLIRAHRPTLVVTTTLYDLAALPGPAGRRPYRLAAAVLDVPPGAGAGLFDRRLNAVGWGRLGAADVVWASDPFKADLAGRFGRLRDRPVVCYNVPETGYAADPLWPRDGWLRAELGRQGAAVGEAGGCVLLRAGAVGPHGGIEETLDALAGLPPDFVFLMMGRPDPAYRDGLRRRIAAGRLEGRAFLWDRPTDETWKRALLGADVGHLIHGPFPPGPMAELYAVNSSLSNYRLFYYMAAGLPILAYDDPRMAGLYAEVPCFRVARLGDLAADVAAHWRELGAAPGLRRDLGRAGRAAHLAKYNWAAQSAPVMARLGAAGP